MKDSLPFYLLIREGFSNQIKCALACMLSPFSHVQLFVTSRTVACQAPLSLGILQARILGWVAMPSSRASSRPRALTRILCLLYWQVGS